VVRELVGHGLGRSLHEPPEVPNYGKRGHGPLLTEGVVICIEPMINMGRANVVRAKDGWTILAKDRKPSAHFEHTVAIGPTGADVLTTFEPIETGASLEPQNVL
jgi:methionyl aminopeptidase